MKVALVTGAAQRIGAHIAGALAEAGWAVAIHYHGSSQKAEALSDQIRDAGGVAEILQLIFPVKRMFRTFYPLSRNAWGW